MIELKGIEKRFCSGKQTVIALNNIDLQIDKGEFVLLKGPSGCGKSTLLFTIGGLLKPTSGILKVAGKDLYSLSEKERLSYRIKKTGMIYQSYHLLPYFTVKENILVTEKLTGISIDRDELVRIAKRLKIDHRLDHRPSELSVGEKQRVSLARAMLVKPEIILADEPTGNLDPENVKEVLLFLNEYKNDGGTVVMVTHGEEANEFATRQINMNLGSIV